VRDGNVTHYPVMVSQGGVGKAKGWQHTKYAIAPDIAEILVFLERHCRGIEGDSGLSGVLLEYEENMGAV
jgi:hypothetical protein